MSPRSLARRVSVLLLNLCLSCLAVMQGAILLIAAKRAGQVSSELAVHDYGVNCRAEMLIEKNTELTRAIKVLTEDIHHRVIGATPSAAADDVLKTPTEPRASRAAKRLRDGACQALVRGTASLSVG
jgi:uncharacterized membrane protein